MKDYDLEIFEDFGLTIIDEVHHLGAQVFSNLFKKINTDYMCGLTATPKREDKLEKVIYWHIGDILYYEVAQINQNINVMLCNFSIKHNLFNIVINKRTQNAQISTMITNLTNIHERTKAIVSLIINLKNKESKRKILVLSERLEHLERMKQLISDNTNYTTSNYVGGMKDADLKISETKKIIIATYAMAAEGLDIKTLTTLLLATPRTDVTQAVGRILRSKHERPLVIDIIDSHDVFKRQWQKRKSYYKKNKYEIVENGITREKNEIPKKICMI